MAQLDYDVEKMTEIYVFFPILNLLYKLLKLALLDIGHKFLEPFTEVGAIFESAPPFFLFVMQNLKLQISEF